MRYIIFFCCLISFGNLLSQSKISGLVFDANESPVSDANIFISDYYTNKIIDTKETDKKGFFKIQSELDVGVYNLEITRIGFSKHKQTLIIEKNSKPNINLEFTLEISDLFKLSEVIIENKPPVIIKKDTIIYDVKQHTKAYDQNLEQVLSRLEGFELQANGEIKVNGKVINKLLIDGKEISDLGNSILTKSLSPEDVENIEVRFDEKNKRLKESLLSDEKFAVIDIQLNTDLNKDFFGKQQISGGYQESAKVGSYGNFFSLNNSFNLQFFGESTNFGNNFIDLKQIKNIGEEAIQDMFSLPKDFNEVKQRQGLQDELYGFNNFIQSDNSIFGFSMNLVLSEKTDLYIGSFNKYTYIKNKSETNQFFQNELQNRLEVRNKNQDLHSKNKIQLKHTNKNLKIKSDLNYVWFDNNIQNQALTYFDRHFNKANKTNSFYLNNSIEYRLSDKLGTISKTSYKLEKYNIETLFETDDQEIASYIGQSINDEVFSLNQFNNNTEKQFVQSLKLNLKTSWGNHSLGYRFRHNSLENIKTTNLQDQIDFEFNSKTQRLPYQLHNGIYNYQNSLDKLSVNTELKLSKVEFPFGENKKKDYFFQYNLSLNYDLSETSNLSFMLSEELGDFPLNQATDGFFFIDYQTVFQPNNFLEPYFNTTYTLSYFKNFRKRKIEIIAAVLNGLSENLNNQIFSNKLILQQANQLKSSYFAFSSKFKKNLDKVEFIVEPEVLNNNSQFIFNNELQESESKRYLLGLKINTPLFEFIDINILSKFSHFEFRNKSTDFKNNFTFFTNKIALKSQLLNKKLLLAVLYKNVYFKDTDNQFNHLDLAIRKKTDTNWSFFFSLSNLLNADIFETRSFDQALFTSSNNNIFKRYFNMGIQYKFK
ncbi:MAG: carboxypeptidase-like regulatory domain-containing protein [Psychroflexus halocasei]